MTIEEIIEDFAFLDDWEDRYRHVIELGKALEPLSEAERSAENKVAGCVSQVWLVTETKNGGDPVLTFRGESDAHIVQGLIAILLAMYSGHSAQDILALDVKPVFDRLGLDSALSPQRSNGFHAMVERIKRDAAAALQSPPA